MARARKKLTCRSTTACVLFSFSLALSSSFASDQSSIDLKKPIPMPISKVRLISTAPSNTELICSLHAEKLLLGVSESCNFPPDVQNKERIASFNSLKMEKIAKLKPDCVMLVSGQEALANSLKKHGFKTLLLDNSSIQNIGKNLVQIGKVINQEAEANRLSAAFESAISKLKLLTQKDKVKPRVFVVVWPQPLMSTGKTSFMNEGVTIAGGINCTGDMPQPYPRVNQEKLLLLQPDMVIVPQEQAKESFWTKSPWVSMKAVKNKKLFVLPQHETDCLTRPTLRYIDALQWLAIKLHPSLKSEIDKWHEQAYRDICTPH